MPNSLKAKIKKLAYQNIISDKDRDRIIKALEQEPILDKIRAEIDQYLFQNEFGSAYRKEVSQIIDKYKQEG